jgi:hypothetical protein
MARDDRLEGDGVAALRETLQHLTFHQSGNRPRFEKALKFANNGLAAHRGVFPGGVGSHPTLYCTDSPTAYNFPE